MAESTTATPAGAVSVGDVIDGRKVVAVLNTDDTYIEFESGPPTTTESEASIQVTEAT